MSAISGKNGKVLVDDTQAAEITGWRFERTSNNPAWASSGTSGYKTRVAGVKDGSGSFDFKYDSASAYNTLFTEGSAVTLKLYSDTTKYFSVPAVIDSVSHECDIDNGEVVGGSANFSITGAWTDAT